MNTRNDLVAAIYNWHSSVERAVLSLHDAGCNMKRISLIGRSGAFWGQLPALLADSAPEFIHAGGFTFVPGSFAASGSHMTRSVRNLRDITSLADALIALGFSGKSVARYETALKVNDFILVAHGDARDVYRARELLETSGFLTLEHFRAGEVVAHAA